MERFPRGTLPPLPPTIEQTSPCERRQPRVASDLASTCPTCNTLMQPEHAHYRCPTCGYRDSCCF